MAKLKRIQVAEESYQSIIDLAKENHVFMKTDKETVEGFLTNGLFSVISDLKKKVDELENELDSKNFITIGDTSIRRIEKLQALEVLPNSYDEVVDKMLESFIHSNEADIEAAIKQI